MGWLFIGARCTESLHENITHGVTPIVILTTNAVQDILPVCPFVRTCMRALMCAGVSVRVRACVREYVVMCVRARLCVLC